MHQQKYKTKNRKIIAYKDYFNTFFAELDKGTQDKVLYVLMLLRTQDRLPTKFIKVIRDGLFEVRIEYRTYYADWLIQQPAQNDKAAALH